jgi:hypothetical protein
MPIKRILIAATLLVAAAPPAFADGTVLRGKGCGDKIFVAGERGYSVLIASQPDIVGDGDTIIGDINRAGFASFYDSKSGRHFTASIDERGLDKSAITTRIATSCRSQTAYNFTSGQVEHADGCGNRIFVNTPQGYAVLERLSGGIIANGDTLTGEFNRAGRATVKNLKTGAEFVVFVDDFQLPKSAASRKIAETCH